jgi:hypothetical protein
MVDRQMSYVPNGDPIVMTCIECMVNFDWNDLLLLWPKKEEKHGVHTDEPDFFCVPCAKELGIEHLPKHSKFQWLYHGK